MARQPTHLTAYPKLGALVKLKETNERYYVVRIFKHSVPKDGIWENLIRPIRAPVILALIHQTDIRDWCSARPEDVEYLNFDYKKFLNQIRRYNDFIEKGIG